MTTHNSYGWSITEQLDQGIRGFELDIHDSWTLPEIILGKISGRYKGKFKVGHADPGHEVRRTGGNPRGNDLEKWLGKIGDWSRKHEGHPPITVFLDIKKNLIDTNNSPSEQFGLIRLNEQIRNACKDRLFTSQDFVTNPHPTIGDLHNKIIVVLMGFHTLSRLMKKGLGKKSTFSERVRRWFVKRVKWIEEKSHLYHRFVDPIGALKTRVAYQEGRIKNDKNFDPICCVAFNPEDRDKTGFEASLEEKSFFVTAYPPENYSTYWNNDKIVRTDYCKGKSWPPFPEYVNFPATDDWRNAGYHKATTKWVKD
jgi:hypothetical protein